MKRNVLTSAGIRSSLRKPADGRIAIHKRYNALIAFSWIVIKKAPADACVGRANIRKSRKDLLAAGNDESAIQKTGERIVSLRERRQNALTKAALRKDETDRIKATIAFVDEQKGEVEYREALFRSMIEKVTIHDDKITVEFRSGLSIDVET